MDPSVDPCSNFYEFSCGSWNRKNQIPEDKTSINTFRVLDDALLHTLKSLLESPSNNDTQQYEKSMKDFYSSCLDIEHINRIDTGPIMDLLSELGGFPLLEKNWKEEDANLTALLIKTRFVAQNILIRVHVNTNDKDSNSYVLQVDQPFLTLSKSFYIDKNMSKVLEKLKDFMSETAKALKPVEDNEAFQKEVEELLNFEKSLANITISEEKKRMLEENSYVTTIANASDIIGNAFNFEQFVTSIFEHVNITISANETVVLQAPTYLQKLGELLNNTPKRVIVNHAMWQVVASYYTYLPQKFLDMKQDYNKVVAGTSQERPRWTFCVSQTSDNFGMMLGSLYVRKYFNPKAKENAVGLIRDLKNAFARILDEVHWMSEETKLVAKEKIYAMHENIAYPDFILNDTAFSEDSKEFHMNRSEFLENGRKVFHSITINNFMQLRNKVDKTRWVGHPGQINAFYSPNRNQITFPAGILQSPFYHEESPMYLNFGGIGVVIGHEITHGFDDRGRLYDKNGNVKEWWSNEDKAMFINQTKCIIEQYSNYTMDEINQKLNGILTQGENIADNGGLKQSFRAYNAWTAKHGEEQSLPGLPYTPRQLFFINFGQVWCGALRPEYAMQLLKQSKHAPGKLRVKGALVNLEEFAEVYQCPTGSPMNPTRKCRVW